MLKVFLRPPITAEIIAVILFYASVTPMSQMMSSWLIIVLQSSGFSAWRVVA